ncbi:biotin/lipoate A/B protein ligase family protein [Calditrichota bacterium]
MTARLIWDIEPNQGWFNMAADHYLALNYAGSNFDCIVRFYTWEPSAVSLGCNQDPGIIDLERCIENGWDLVYRPTGGRALLHSGDLSYSVIFRNLENPLAKLRWLYQQIELAIKETVRAFGVIPDTKHDFTKAPNAESRPLRKDLCMTSLVRGEVTYEGRKFTGAAQHVYQDSLLQHGSIALKTTPSAIAEVMSVEESVRQAMRHKLDQESMSLAEIYAEITHMDFTLTMKRNLIDSLSLKVQEIEIQDDETSGITSLREDFELLSAPRKHAGILV